MKPKTLIMAVLAVLLLAGAAWQLVDRHAGDAVHAPQAAVAAVAAPVLPDASTPSPVVAASLAPPSTDPDRPAVKRTQLPNGTILIENQPLTLRHADGRVEEKLVRMVAKPVKKPVLKRLRPAPAPGDQPAAATTQDGTPAPAQVVHLGGSDGSGGATAPGSGSGINANPAGTTSGDAGGAAAGTGSDGAAPAGGSANGAGQPPKTGG